MRAQIGRRLGRIVVLPFATIGVIAAVLEWEIEHVGSIVLAVVLAGIAVAVGVIVARRVRAQIEELEAYYESLLHTAEDESANVDVSTSFSLGRNSASASLVGALNCSGRSGPIFGSSL